MTYAREGWMRSLFQQGSIAMLLTAFVVYGFLTYRDAQADDLASSYIGCRLMATGNAAHLYDYDPEDFAAVGDNEAWQEAADFGGFTSYQHPYVQTPLWASLLRPVCGGSFAAFRHLFAGAALFAFAACLWLVARYWAPTFLSPLPLGVALLCLWFAEPFRYAMFLVQTHVLFLLLTVAALILAERRRPGWAGLLLACAAAVKITPAVLILYWLLTRRWKAAVSMACWSGALIAVTVVMSGWPLFTVYLADLHRIANVMLLAFNNQSFAAWVMGYFYPDQVSEFNILPLPTAVRLGSTALMLVLTAVGGILDRHKPHDPQANLPPFGALIALVAATVCAPIAWTHYSIVLAVPLMVLWHEGKQRRSYWLAAGVILILVLNFQPLASNMAQGTGSPFALIRSEFYAGVFCMATLASAWWVSRRSQHREAPKSSSNLLLEKEAVLVRR